MRLIVMNKSRACVADLTLDDGPVPRAGEELALPQYADDCDGMSEFLVLEVVWLLVGSKLQAEVTCMAQSPQHRRLQNLRDHAWLSP